MRQTVPIAGRLLAAWGVMLSLHVVLGWAWTVGGGVLVGLWCPRHGSVLGGLGGALGWATLVLYSFVVAPSAFRALVDTLGALGGNIPGEAFVGATVLLGGGLGASGGYFGASGRALWASAVGRPS